VICVSTVNADQQEESGKKKKKKSETKKRKRRSEVPTPSLLPWGDWSPFPRAEDGKRGPGREGRGEPLSFD